MAPAGRRANRDLGTGKPQRAVGGHSVDLLIDVNVDDVEPGAGASREADHRFGPPAPPFAELRLVDTGGARPGGDQRPLVETARKDGETCGSIGQGGRQHLAAGVEPRVDAPALPGAGKPAVRWCSCCIRHRTGRETRPVASMKSMISAMRPSVVATDADRQGKGARLHRTIDRRATERGHLDQVAHAEQTMRLGRLKGREGLSGHGGDLGICLGASDFRGSGGTGRPAPREKFVRSGEFDVKCLRLHNVFFSDGDDPSGDLGDP